MSKIIAFAGKGGVGKTTVAALVIRYLAANGKTPILAVDADPNSNLGETLGLPPDAPFALFAVARCAGWIAHAMEQGQTDQLIRPRARYVGPAPG